MKTILISYGTRPEYIKVKSLIDNLSNTVNIKTLFTGQHIHLVNSQCDYHINIDDYSENRLNNIIINQLMNIYVFEGIDYVLVQGDTTSALSIALSAFNSGIKVIHLEAGLRTYNINDPYPEELNRQMISRIANINFCPTELNKNNLISEKVHGDIYVTGNTGLDNITKNNIYYGNKILITLHRRDNHHIMDKWFSEIEKIANKYVELEFIIPIHPNPNVSKHKHIFNKVKVINPISHNDLLNLIKECKFIISDSGGIQEEASFLNKKIIIGRKTTERPEVLEDFGKLCSDPNDLENIFNKFNSNYIVDSKCPFGDGNAWVRIKNILSNI
jgi:UDP-N-acetylglucosamine 2-epimerase (non-hydrolysing)